MLNKPQNNMYDWITGTWNPISGVCSHSCSYCFTRSFTIPLLKKKYSGQPRLCETAMRKNLGRGKFWFVCSCSDLFAWDVPMELIDKILYKCKCYKNKYLFQSKNPERMREFYGYFPDDSIFGTTLESNREYKDIYGNAPQIMQRYDAIADISNDREKVIVTIEPILDFDTEDFLGMLHIINPKWVNIGADSKGHNLPEPPKEKVLALIEELRGFTEVKIKPNLKRIIGNI